MPHRVVFYARVSTLEQHIDPQLHALRQYATARELEVVGEYVDHGVSGAKDRRPALDKLLADARRRRFDVLAITKLDRLARSVRHLTTLAAELEALGVDLVVLDQAIDTSTPSGRFLFNTLGAVAELERDLIRERVLAGLAAAKRRGAKLGRPRVDLDGERVARLCRAGKSIRAIAGMLGVSKDAVAREIARQGPGRDRTSKPATCAPSARPG
ncbi:MAG TPA: recombinase family protein [Myxococcota bacterium]|nr:recombinase family protein [Myxococcota bacterium]